MRVVPIPPFEPSYKSITAKELIAELQKLDPDTVIMDREGNVISSIEKDSLGYDIAYLTP